MPAIVRIAHRLSTTIGRRRKKNGLKKTKKKNELIATCVNQKRGRSV